MDVAERQIRAVIRGHTRLLLWSGLGISPAPRLGKKDKPLRTSGIYAVLPKKPDPSLL